MYITKTEFITFDENALEKLLEKRIQEGHHIDYKVKLSGESIEKHYKEFLKDVTAFANANGGNILIGVKDPYENKTIPVEKLILGIDDGDKVSHSLENVAASCIDPRISGLQVKPVLLNNGKHVILIHIPPSLGRPHIVYYHKITSIHIRNFESSRPMTSFEINQAVVSSATTKSKT